MRTLAALRRQIGEWRAAGETVALVPTMGALHRGHLALVADGLKRCDRVVTSIFVNPTQFAPTEDFSSYPRTFDDDRAKLSAAGGDLIWAPSVDVMYPPGDATRVVPGGAAVGLESDFRPHFFNGVATVCCKLFCQVGPDIAVFGEKDYQQLAVVTQMARDLALPMRVIGHPTVREDDGLAMSSRNVYLSPEQRRIAVAMNQVIAKAAKEVGEGLEIAAVTARARAALTAAGFDRVDYVEVRDAETLASPDPASARALRVLAAAWLGKTRLIDNCAAASPAADKPRKRSR